MSELKACPFCGRPATDSEKVGIKSDLEGWGWVGCQPCRVHIDYMNGERGKQLAIQAWNRRTEPNEALTVEELREMLGEPVWVAKHHAYGIVTPPYIKLITGLSYTFDAIEVGAIKVYRHKPEVGE